MSTYLISQPHDSTRGCNSDEATGNESLDTGFLCSLGERNLILLLRGTYTTDHDVDPSKGSSQCLFGAFQVTFADLNSTLLQGNDGRFLDGTGTDQGVDFL